MLSDQVAASRMRRRRAAASQSDGDDRLDSSVEAVVQIYIHATCRSDRNITIDEVISVQHEWLDGYYTERLKRIL